MLQLPLLDLVFQAQTVHRQHAHKDVQLASLMSIKTGACPEDCKYCPQSAHYNTELKKEPLQEVDDVLRAAAKAKANGASRFCMGAAWRSPPSDNTAKGKAQFDAVLAMVRGVRALGMEACVTLGMLSSKQAQQLAEAGLTAYNHNLDTGENYYKEIITTRSYADRLQTLQHVRDAGVQVCSGGIIGMGESWRDRADMLTTLANHNPHPESVPINALVAVEGTPLEKQARIDPLDLVRMCAAARITMPASRVRLSAGRLTLSREAQVLCMMAGANSIFYGEKLLTTGNNDCVADKELLAAVGVAPTTVSAAA